MMHLNVQCVTDSDLELAFSLVFHILYQSCRQLSNPQPGILNLNASQVQVWCSLWRPVVFLNQSYLCQKRDIFPRRSVSIWMLHRFRDSESGLLCLNLPFQWFTNWKPSPSSAIFYHQKGQIWPKYILVLTWQKKFIRCWSILVEILVCTLLLTAPPTTWLSWSNALVAWRPSFQAVEHFQWNFFDWKSV